MISLSKTFQLGNSRVKYIRSGNTRRGGEMITIDGPLEKSLDIMVSVRLGRPQFVIVVSHNRPFISVSFLGGLSTGTVCDNVFLFGT